MSIFKILLVGFLLNSKISIEYKNFRPSPEGRGGDESHDGYTPLHLCCQWGLVDVVQALVEHDTEINKTVNPITNLFK